MGAFESGIPPRWWRYQDADVCRDSAGMTLQWADSHVLLRGSQHPLPSPNARFAELLLRLQGRAPNSMYAGPSSGKLMSETPENTDPVHALLAAEGCGLSFSQCGVIFIPGRSSEAKAAVSRCCRFSNLGR